MTDPSVAGDELDALLDYLRESRGFDFGGYKRTGLARRITHRMSQAGIDSFHDYLDLLQVDAAEFTALFNTILINVTGFFRDPEAWDRLRTEVVPGLLAERSPGDPLRVWSTGCSSGQEAYSLAMLLAEELGTDAYLQQVKIYATDIDDDALSQARHAAYQEAELEGVPDELRTKYFEKRGDRYVFTPDLRRTVIFGRNDLVQDAPISRVDLLLCRNTLMYFNAETQQRVLNRFHFALVPRGVLFLGRAEMLLGRSRMFEPIDLKQRIFRRVADRSMTTGRRPLPPPADGSVTDRLRELALAASPIAQLVVGLDDTLVMQSDQAASLFGLSRRDLGRPIRELEVSYQPLALRSHLDQVIAEQKPIRVSEVEFGRAGGVTHWFEVHLTPVLDSSVLLGVSVVFHDVTATRALRQEVERSGRQLEATNAELQSTNEELEMRILAWNAAAQELWGVRGDEAEGQNLLNLDVGLPADVLRPLVRAALSDPAGASETRLDAVNRRGRAIVDRLLCSALRGPDGQQRGVLLTMEPV